MSAITPIRRALISVSDKTALIELGQGLADRDIEIISTGGSARALRDAGITVTDVSDVTGFPEIMDGRVKTLNPLIHGGILARRDDDSHNQHFYEASMMMIFITMLIRLKMMIMSVMTIMSRIETMTLDWFRLCLSGGDIEENKKETKMMMKMKMKKERKTYSYKNVNE